MLLGAFIDGSHRPTFTFIFFEPVPQLADQAVRIQNCSGEQPKNDTELSLSVV